MAFEIEWSKEALEDIESIVTYNNKILFVAVVHGKMLLENYQKSITNNIK